jgi:hypothetical protein
MPALEVHENIMQPRKLETENVICKHLRIIRNKNKKNKNKQTKTKTKQKQKNKHTPNI